MLVKAKNYIINLDGFSSISADSENNDIKFNFDNLNYIVKFNPALNAEGFINVIWDKVVSKEEILILNEELIENVELGCYISLDSGDFEG